MSAGYDGKTIIWDIWEGKPVQIYETGHFKLVDGKFSPDGTSLILTDEIGQIFIIGTGQGMIPYPEPFQSMYQKRWLVIDPDRWEPLPEITDFIDLEPENEVISDDTDSEYDGLDDKSSEGEQEILSGDSSDASYSSAEIDGNNLRNTANLHRSRRKKKKSDADLVTSSGRRVKKRNLDEHDVANVSRPHRSSKSKTPRLSKRKRSPEFRGLRPQRRAARNALSFFKKVGASTEDYEDDSENSLSDTEFNTESTEAEHSAWYSQPRLGRESNQHDSDVTQPSHFPETRESCGNNRKLVLRIPCRDSEIQYPSMVPLAATGHGAVEPEPAFEPGGSSACKAELTADGGQTATSLSSVHSYNTIKWGEVKLRSKRCRMYKGVKHAICLDSIHENHETDAHSEGNFPSEERITNNNDTYAEEVNNKECNQQFHSTSQPASKLKLVSSRGFTDGTSSSDKSKATAVGSDMNFLHHKVSVQHDQASATNKNSTDFPSASRNFQECTGKSTGLHDSRRLHFESAKAYGAVYRRKNLIKQKKNLDSDSYGNGDSTSVSNDDGGYQPPDCSPVATGTGSLRRSGHEEYLSRMRLTGICPWNRIKGLKAVELCKIQGLLYTTYGGSGESCSAIVPNWVVRDRCRVWWADDGEEGGSWWEGGVSAIRAKSTDFPESPWEKYVIQYENDGSEHLHSPWELHDADNLMVPWKHPHIDSSIRNKLLSAVTTLQKMSHTNKDHYGVLKLDTVTGKSDFINRFPVQFSIEVIRARLHNNYYRTVEAVQHDATVMLENAESYFSKNSEMTKRILRLFEWIQDKILSL
ncbi:hypothetical protein ACQ4PT_038394 [Festuca glaucescens]